ncbi:hypothetical protein O6H91_23G006700 [Diphasiastrum complanatum]|uniref:Uncharacterized protein n=1 Tax=Diphasiastrum complanatum TaxID=34168 RepID=A0ACC2A7T8_DIPCM|nr:hypothetical protein O6H91_23G006700 [Diphasiastrum complanatum]
MPAQIELQWCFFGVPFPILGDGVIWRGTGSCELYLLPVRRVSKYKRNLLFAYRVLRRDILAKQSKPLPKEDALLGKQNDNLKSSCKCSSRFLTCQTGDAKHGAVVHEGVSMAGNCGPQNERSQSFYSSANGMEGKIKETGSVPPTLESKKLIRLLIVLRQGLLMWIGVSSIAWLGSSGTAKAVVNTAMPGIHPLAKMQAIVASAWPKTLLVLGVFRDQGLLLSVLLGLSAFFSMAETSITTLWPWKVRELAEKEGENGVFRLLRQDITRFLTTILIGTTVANIAATALVTDAATALFGEAGVTAAAGVMTVVVLLLTEIAPKSVAVHNATAVARFVVRPVAWLSIILYPVGRVVTAISTRMLKFLGLKSSGEPFVTEEELKLMLRGAELSGAIEEEEQDMIENVLEIKDTYVREVMTPLVDVVAIDAEATLMDFRNLWVKHQYSRVPVFERRVDNIVGIAYAMDMLDYVEEVELLQRLTVGRIAHRPAYFVPDSMSVWNLLREFRIRKVHMAIVLNEYGGTIGVATLEDVVEEIVGEIFDESDSKEEIRRKTGYVIQRADGVFDVDANTSIEDLAEALVVKVPEGPYYYETVSGFICEAFGYIPRMGESITITLRKADTEDSSDHREGEPDHPDDHKGKLQSFKLEILAGNARKVGSVRFERVESSEIKEGEPLVRSFPRILKRGWKQQQELVETPVENEEKIDVTEWSTKSDLCVPTSLEEDEDLCDAGDKTGLDTQLKQDESAADIKSSDSKYESGAIGTDGLTLTGSQEWQLNMVEDNKTFDIETNDEVDCSTASAVGTFSEKSQKHENQVERRRHRRRKQSLEAAAELHKWQKADERRRDPEKATLILRKAGDQDSDNMIEQGC